MKLLFAFAVVASLVVACSSTCTGACQHEYGKCMDRAGPGAARADCQAQYDQCVKSCDS